MDAEVDADVEVEVDAEAEVDVLGGGTVMVCVTVTVGVGAGVVGDAVVVCVTVAVGVVVGAGVGVGDAVAAVTGSQDWLPAACAAAGANATSAVALLAEAAETKKMPQEAEASKTPVADKVTTVRRLRVKRISPPLGAIDQYRRETTLGMCGHANGAIAPARYLTPFVTRKHPFETTKRHETSQNLVPTTTANASRTSPAAVQDRSPPLHPQPRNPVESLGQQLKTWTITLSGGVRKRS